MTELRVNLLFLGWIAAAAFGLSATRPVAALDPNARSTQDLAELEDRFALAPGDHDAALALATAYLERRQPALAVTAIRAAEPRLLESPSIAHRLAQAFERSGRVGEALRVAERALASCRRSVAAANGDVVRPLPIFACSAPEEAVLEVHRAALARMVDWRVGDPEADPRGRLAYDLAMRRARIAVAD